LKILSKITNLHTKEIIKARNHDVFKSVSSLNKKINKKYSNNLKKTDESKKIIIKDFVSNFD
tara:strand:+ start:602 stop:787 length:186 start_codon:yes stop_codon:yes gene_type:complete